MAALTPQTRSTGHYIGWSLLALLLFLRLPFLVGGYYLSEAARMWVVEPFINSTYVVNALLIFWERDRLEEFHIDGWALAIYILPPLLLWPIDSAYVPWTQVAAAGLLLAALLVTRTRLPRARRETLVWLGAAVGVGVLLALVAGLGGRLTDQPRGMTQMSLLVYLPLFATQLVRAASLEEPLFRGFLWGYLRQAGWQDRTIWLVQAGLFWAGHLYYFGKIWYSFWVVVPVCAVAIGWVVWRSRSIGASMVTHGITNSLADAISHFRWW